MLYSHRAQVLHALSVSMPDALCLSARSVILAIVPMFHANSWGLAFAAPLTGAKLVLPGEAACACAVLRAAACTASHGLMRRLGSMPDEQPLRSGCCQQQRQ